MMRLEEVVRAIAAAATLLGAVACREAPLDSTEVDSSWVSPGAAELDGEAPDAGPPPCAGAGGLGEFRFKFCDQPAGSGLLFGHYACMDAYKLCLRNRGANAARSVACTWTQDGGTEVLLVQESAAGDCDPYLGAWPLPSNPMVPDGGR